jgi:hypothetical protein
VPVSYEVEGQLLEVCTCNILCPCWLTQGCQRCDGLLAWHYDKGTVNGVDIAGRTVVIATHTPGTIREGGAPNLAYIDGGATSEQRNVLYAMWSGQLDGPARDLAALIGEVLAVELTPITFEVEGATGRLQVGPKAAFAIDRQRHNSVHGSFRFVA